jgi:hypothetical protein
LLRPNNKKIILSAIPVYLPGFFILKLFIMKKRILSAACFIAIVFMACSGANNEKRIVIMASGSITVTDKTIKLDPSMSHNEQEIIFKDDKLTLTLQTTAGINKTYDLTDNGVYVLNLQRDTLTGGLVNYGASGRPGSITAEQRDHIIDSSKQLLLGTNASDANGTYFIPPLTIKKVSVKSNTKIIGAFKGIPYTNEADNSGSVPDVIKLFTNKQKRETLTDLENQKIKI